jgi:purine-binding chemotaxis protein CheW
VPEKRRNAMTVVSAESEEYLSFMLGEEVFALDISKVREVLDYRPVTSIPQTPDFILGVINLRGNAVPVVDMRQRFGMGATERSVNTCIIIVEVDVSGEPTVLGAMADAVKEVFELSADEVEPPPRMGTNLDVTYLKGMGSRNDEFLLLLDIDKVFSDDEIQAAMQVKDSMQQPLEV